MAEDTPDQSSGELQAVDRAELMELLRPDRLNTLVDAVYAIIMTLLVLELKLPVGISAPEALGRLHEITPKLVAYLMGFAVAGSGWAYVHQINGLFARTNLLHVAINLVALMLASLIPFSASVMGTFPDASYGPQLYAVNVGLLTAVYGLDLLTGTPRLIPPTVDRRFLSAVTILVFMGASWCLFVGLVIAPWSPRIALWALALHFLTHWLCLAATERALRKASIQVEQWGAHHTEL